MICKFFNWSFLLLVSLFLFSCKNNSNTSEKFVVSDSAAKATNKQNYLQVVKDYEGKIKASQKFNDTLAIAMSKAYSDYALSFEEDSLSPDFLFKAAELSVAAKRFEQGVIYYKTVFEKYPSFKYAKESLYLIAFVYDSYLNDDIKAKEYYELFISKFPNSKLSDDAKAAIQLLGKSDEELIEEFKKKNTGA